MGIYINNKIIMDKQKKEQDEMDKAMITMQLADKEAKLKQVQMENAIIMAEIAQLKGVK